MSGAEQFRLVAGAQVIDNGTDELHVVLANHTVTLTGADIVAVARVLLAELATGSTRDAAVAAVSARQNVGGPAQTAGGTTQSVATTTGHDAAAGEVGRYVYALLERNGCLAVAHEGTDRPLWQFWAADGLDPVDAEARQAASPVVLVTPTSLADMVAVAADAAGLTVTVVGLDRARPAELLAEHVADAALVAGWGLAYHGVAAGELNRAALTDRVPALYGAAAGRVGRIGPCVLPYATACLECASLRLRSHAGPAESRMVRALRAAQEAPVEPPPTHPLFAQAMLSLFLVEVGRICLDQPPACVGGIVELEYGVPASIRRTLHRVPTCPACHPESPGRFGWDAAVRGSVLAQEDA